MLPVDTPQETFGISSNNAAQVSHVVTYGQEQALEIGLSPNGNRIAIRSTTGVGLFDANTWEPVQIDLPNQFVSHMAFSPERNLMAIRVPAANEIEIWRLPEGQLVPTFAIPGKTIHADWFKLYS